ncbi:hypothetical protein IQ03_03478 [Gemmobacter caeni]|uniref:Uncharacterized protein n=1 Tax=Gemmobacter caeni TaxID=589035 RepID=A0A2T6AT81_9RHOB|nr:hypothetical protein [Gemmobacter caeni]PTX47025.1 hypothetical protein C8N34_11445 [Gemmobacter caeni]TWI96118.1 hypothetical protein IQ03_03478 [Gemmobacter caeni]
MNTIKEQIRAYEDMSVRYQDAFPDFSGSDAENEYNVDELFERGEVHAFLDDRNGIWIRVHGDDERTAEDVKLGARVTCRGPMTVKHLGGGKTVVRIFDFPADVPDR